MASPYLVGLRASCGQLGDVVAGRTVKRNARLYAENEAAFFADAVELSARTACRSVALGGGRGTLPIGYAAALRSRNSHW
jgi:hypothetical protein